MTKDKNYDVSLVSVGTIDSELHFRPFSYEWWIVCNQEIEFLVPIRLHMKVVTHLSEHDFILTVVKGNREHFEQPEYICTCESFYTTEPSISSSNAISTVYQQMFHTKTRFSGPMIMGFDKPDICKKLLEGVLFRPYFVNFELVRVFVFGIARSENDQWGYAGVGFKSSFLFYLAKEHCLFLQELKKIECELNVWRIMLRNIGCHDVTPFSKQDLKLYEFGFLMSQPVNFYDVSNTFWNCFQESLTTNKKGDDGKQRILSIIANDFKYEELQKQLSVSNDLISKARIHCHLNGPGGSSMKKPSFTREKLLSEKLQEFEKFINDKAHVVMSSYKTDSKTGAPIKYLRDTKQALWEKFHAEFPNGIHRTTFKTKLQGNEYIYREDLGGLCSTCSRFSGPMIMGFDKPDICKKLLEGVLFRPYFVNFELVRVFVFGIARSENDQWGYAGVGFKSNHKFSECELNVWRIMLRNIGCHDVTPFSKQDLKLYEFGFLMSQPVNFYDVSNTFWNCFQESLTTNKKGDDGKQRILSIIANDFKYEELQKQLSVSNDLISKARIHCHLNGPGGSSMKKPSFTREKLLSEKLQEFEKFINDKAHVVMSSYKTDSKTGAPIKYLRDTKQALWEKFHAEFPNGIHRTTFKTKLQGNEYIYREDLGGLCSTCSRYGYEIFVDIRKLIENKFIDSVKKKEFLDELEQLQQFLKRDYEKNLIVNNKGITEHNPCISYCLLWAFGVCTEQHTHASQEYAKLFTFFNRLKNQLSTDLHEDLDEYQNHLLYYLAHQVRKVYLNAQFNANLLDLDENGAVLVVDYKMKILPKSARETKAEFFGKKGWTLHTILMYTKKSGHQELNIHAYDHWSMDTHQDSWFTASSLHAVIESLENKPKWITIISDNGPHYHNADLIMILGN
ncbi:hypothetical protein RhiirA5_470704 [Rhizophagus irregularis]|uniref:Uncharacterized protein n=1 Tax=Rhizophagus irregularis TaxID=588596 RepID=A0A2N0NPS7_9GLOM|nr:hypothetical protein RhiirA5_470704 [Rhizophagus irregularis]